MLRPSKSQADDTISLHLDPSEYQNPNNNLALPLGPYGSAEEGTGGRYALYALYALYSHWTFLSIKGLLRNVACSSPQRPGGPPEVRGAKYYTVLVCLRTESLRVIEKVAYFSVGYILSRRPLRGFFYLETYVSDRREGTGH